MKKTTKLLFSLASTLLMATGCQLAPTTSSPADNPTTSESTTIGQTAAEKVTEAHGLLVYSGLTAVTSDIQLITSIPGLEDVKITYTVKEGQNYLKLSEDGSKIEVTRPKYEEGDQMIQQAFTATLSLDGETQTKPFNVKVIKESTIVTASQFLAVTNDTGTVYGMYGEVFAEGYGCLLVGDSTGFVYVYSNDCAKVADVGDFVLVEGGYASYNGVPQFAYSSKVVASITKLASSDVKDSYRFTAPEATAMSAADIETLLTKTAVSDIQGKHIKVEGTLSIDKANHKYNLALAGSNAKVNVAYPGDDFAAELTALEGKLITVTGYTLYNKTSDNMVYIFGMTAAEVTVTEAEKVELAKNALTVEENVKENFTLPANGTYGTSISWTSDKEELTIGAKGETGYPVTVTQKDEPVEVKLTATITLGETTATKEFTVTVLPLAKFVYTMVTTPEVGVAYKFGMTTPDSTLYFTGSMDANNKYGATTEAGDLGVDVYLEAVEGGYHLYFNDAENVKKYIEIVQRESDATKADFKIVDTPTIAMTYNTEYNTLVATYGDNSFFCGTYTNKGTTYTTISASNASYISSDTNYHTHFYKAVDESKLPVTTIPAALAAEEGREAVLEGTVCEIYEEWSSYGNMSFYIKDAEENKILVFRTKTQVELGDVVKVEGTVTIYKGTAQIAQGSTTTIINGSTEEPENPEPETPTTVTTISAALAASEGTSAVLEGTVCEIYEEWSSYGNMSFYIKDAEENKILVFRTNTQVGLGDVVKVEGTVTIYYEKAQIAQGSTTTVVTAHTCSTFTDADCLNAAKCTVCGKEGTAALGHTEANAEGNCDRCGANIAQTSETITASKTMADLITEYGWTNSTTKQEFKLDDVVTVKVDGGSNTGKAYSGDHIRMYATDTPAGTLTISVPEGYELVSVKVSCQTGTYAFLYVDGTTTDISNVETAVSGSSVVLKSVKNGTDGKQVRITAMAVTYRAI